MKTLKLIIIALLLLPLLWLVSADTTFAELKAENLQNVALIGWGLVIYLVARFTPLFQHIITEEENVA